MKMEIFSREFKSWFEDNAFLFIISLLLVGGGVIIGALIF
jgi:hypothetical protein